MFPLSASSRLVLDSVLALAMTPVAIELALVWRAVARRKAPGHERTASGAVAVAALAVSVWLAAVLVLPRAAAIEAADLGNALAAARERGDAARAVDLASRAVQQTRGRVVLPSQVPEALLRAGRFGELQYYFGGLLARDVDLGWTDLLVLARTARQGGWERMDAIGQLIARAGARPELRAAAALLASSAGGVSPAASDALFAMGARAENARTPLAVFDGWIARDAGRGRCDLVVHFTPQAELDGARVWLHAYPPGAHEYVDVGRSFPAAAWKAGERAWEVFDFAAPRGSGLYAGVSTGGDLGPAAALGRVMDCGAR
jgi:hypothetical protein